MRTKKIAFTKDGAKLATNCTRIYTQTGKPLLILPSCDPEYKDLRYQDWELAYSKTGKYLAEGSSWGELKLWNTNIGQLTMDKQELGNITALSISENESFLAVGTDYVSLWDTENTSLIKNFYPGTGRIEYVGFETTTKY
ncbi:MAG: WD40 repeat domain-containing protein [Anaerolineales bacterium]